MRIGNLSINNLVQIKPISGDNRSYKAGQEIEGEVMKVSDGKVTLKLSDGSEVNATLRTNMQLMVGDSLTLVVSPQDPTQKSGQVSLKLSNINGQEVSPNASPLENLLLNSGEGYTSGRMEIAQILHEMRLPISSSLLTTIESALASFSGLSPKLAAFMASQGIPIDQQNIAVLASWLTENLQLPELLNNLQSLGSSEQSAQGAQSAQTGEAQVVPTPQGEGQAAQGGAQVPVQDGQAQGAQAAQAAQQGAQAAVTQEQAGAQQATQGGAQAAEAQVAQPQGGTAPAVQTLIDAFMQKLDPQLARDLQSSSLMMDNLTELFSAPPKDVGRSAVGLLKTIPQGFSPALKSDILFALAKTLQDARAPQPQSAPIGEQMTAARAAGQPLEALVDSLLGHSNKLFAKLSPAEPNAQTLQNALKELPEFLSTLKATAQSSQPLTQAAAGAVQLLNQAKLGNEFANFLYAQIPFTAFEQKHSAHLYVMKRNGGSGKIDRENVTMLVSLMTQNLGQVDSVIKIEQNVMQLSLRVESARSKSILESGLPLLKELMQDTTYRLASVKVSVTEDKISPINAVEIATNFKNQLTSGLDLSV